MKKKLYIPALLCTCALLLSACGAPANTGSHAEAENNNDILTIAATTYPVYEFATTLTEGMENVEVELVVKQQISCLHDYTLTVSEMKTLENADVILLSGAGLEDFMSSTLSAVSAPVVDCSEGIALLPAASHEHGGSDPHIWLDPLRAVSMMETMAKGLAEIDSNHSLEDYEANLAPAKEELTQHAALWKNRFAALPEAQRNLITFHDGFSYLADAFDLQILKSIEEEAGSEASAKDILHIVELVKQYELPMIFVEANGSDATATAIQRETGVEIGTLSMIMSDNGMTYLENLDQNLTVIYEGLTGEEVPADAD